MAAWWLRELLFSGRCEDSSTTRGRSPEHIFSYAKTQSFQADLERIEAGLKQKEEERFHTDEKIALWTKELEELKAKLPVSVLGGNDSIHYLL